MHSLKVLLIEPHPYRLMALHQTLNAHGVFDVRVAESGAQAQGVLARRGAVDIAICDVLAGEYDGVALVRYLARHALAASLIILSGARRSVLDGASDLVEQSGLPVLGVLPTPACPLALHRLLLGYRTRLDAPAQVA
ncbi:response regulator transcription factor [Pseudomonas sp. MAFF212428]|uniref:Response regulator transcription factor n=1 Tax=Pseudomonas brassicae TaxID=2708063 RepID=A0A6B3NNM9_9PSED|nr:response regulator [Pseudomonas brassicae]NER60539.1 response regulator transcription factor [Pseudomonas brassicae]NER64775.1 response regulator transcription factor [Pseudomonas brassicae]